jgi:hypothetical protein
MLQLFSSVSEIHFRIAESALVSIKVVAQRDPVFHLGTGRQSKFSACSGPNYKNDWLGKHV